MGSILKVAKISGKRVAALVLLVLAASVAEMMLPTLLAQMIDDGVGQASRATIVRLAIGMGVMAAVSCLGNLISTVISADISSGFAADIRTALFDKVQDFSAAEMDRFGTASLVTRSTSDVTNVQTFLSLLLRIGVMAPLMAVAGLVLSASTGGKVSSVLNTAIPVLLIVVAIIILIVARYSVAMRQKTDAINKRFLETLEGTRVIRAFNRQEREIGRFAATNADFARTAIASGRINGLLMPAINLIFGITTVAVMALGSVYVYQGQMEVGALIANSQYISMILTSVIMLAAVIMFFPTAYACGRRIAEVLDAEVSIEDGSHELADRPERATVRFDKVTFAYPGSDEPVLHDISFQSGPGEVTAIIGRTGCGKSSILKLVPRLYDPVVGHVYVDGMDARKYRLEDLRGLIGYVPQKNVLFSGDIASNLNFGNEKGAEEDWREAARIACADEFIGKKDGTWHADVAQGGTNFSGGQRQRMAIARAVMKRPEVYLFDDSFSALDMKTDRELRARLRQSMGDATMVIVAQRVSSIIDADRILVLDGGTIVGNGTHKELLRTCSLYREIAELQLGEEAVRNELA